MDRFLVAPKLQAKYVTPEVSVLCKTEPSSFIPAEEMK